MQKLWAYSISPDALFKISKCATLEALQDAVNQILSDLGFHMATYHLLRVNGHGNRLLTFFSNYPEEWLRRYVDQRYMFDDIVHTQARSSIVPFAWSDCKRREINEKSGLIFAEASEFGILDGFSVPIHTHNSFAVFSVLADGSKTEREKIIEMGRGAVTMLGLQVHERAVTLLADDVAEDSQIAIHLTPREKECLRWFAAGKNNADISSILCISRSTVDYYSQAVMRKLNTTSRVQAAVRAMSLGLIDADYEY